MKMRLSEALTAPGRRSSQLRAVSMVMMYLLTIVIVFMVDLPIISMISTAFKSEEAVRSSVSLFPAAGEFTLENFIHIFSDSEFRLAMFNSMFIALCTSAVMVFVASMAGYALSRFRGRVFMLFGAMLIVTEAFPVMLRLIPMFRMYVDAGLMNTHIAVILCHIAQSLAFCTMMTRGFYESSVPRDMEEAAMVDGCSRFGTYLRIALPVSLPGIATIAIYSFLDSWNEYMYANLLLREDTLQTLTLYVSGFSGKSGVNWSMLSAASTLASLPAMAFLLFAQKYLIQGMTDGAVKG
uniref:Putative ATPbinding transport protein n=1 Tax=termite gut metagenome TaxID=433724 RepID=S0DEM9_9ZZZZ